MDEAALREDMVDGLEHALDRPVDERVVDAMRTVPRHDFLDDAPYANREAEAVGTRVLAPATVARLVEALDPPPGEDVLVVGAGVGYTAAVLAELVGARHVHAVDIAWPAVRAARANLAEAGHDAVLVDRRDGSDGLPEYAPFARVLVEATAVRPPPALVDQLAPDGRLVIPLGAGEATLAAVERADGEARVAAEFGSLALAPLLVDGEQAGAGTRNRTRREDREFAGQGHFAPAGWEHEWIDWDDRLDGGRGHRRRR
jgi:protein-L-isoaspartate(D-aspartate) O-methyltransferase